MPTSTPPVPVIALTFEGLFDLIAPIAIYHGADVCFKVKALQAIRQLRRAVRAGDALAVKWIGTPKSEDFVWDDMLQFSELPNDRDVRCVYDELLIELVSEQTEDWELDYDRSGCRCFKTGGARIDAFCGDSPGHFAWYETAALVAERAQDHVAEAV